MLSAHYFLCIADNAVTLAVSVLVSLDGSFEHSVFVLADAGLDYSQHILYAVSFHDPVEQVKPCKVFFSQPCLASRSSFDNRSISLLSK